MNRFWFRRQKDIGALPERVLMVHPFGLGDALFITPVLRLLRESGVKQLDLLLGSRTRELFEKNPFVNDIFEWDKSPVSGFSVRLNRFKTLAQLFWVLWRKRYQMMIDFSPRAQYALLSWLLFWIPIRIGFNFKNRGFSLTHRIEIPEGFRDKHVVEYYLDLLQFLNLPSKSKSLELYLDEEDRRNGEEILRKLGLHPKSSFLAVVPGGGESWGKDARLKRWPVESFGRLIHKLYEHECSSFDFVLILGTQNERPLAEELISFLKGIPTYHVCGNTSIREAAALIQKASFLLANDGGLVHMAHAMQTPLIAIYGPVDPVVYGPYPHDSKSLVMTNIGPACRPCYQRFRYQDRCIGVECLTSLTVEAVFDRMRSRSFLERLFSVSISR